MSAKAYKQAIDILTSNDRVFTTVEIELAKLHPALFVRFAADPRPKWQDTVKELLHSGHFIDAIKEIRNATNLGLKEAKDVADYIRGNRDCALSAEHEKLAREIMG
jgi:ribosomal protein L7/L12